MKGTFDNASESFKARNPHLYPVAQLRAPERQRDAVSQPARGDDHETAGPRSVVISLVSFRHRTLDSDNVVFGFKWLRDAISKTIGFDDGDPRITWEYAQVRTEGHQGTVVKIELT